MRAAFLLACLLLLFATTFGFLPDPFTVFQTVLAEHGKPSVTGTITHPSVAGGKRNMTVTILHGGDSRATGVINEYLSLSNNGGVRGSLSVVYPGIDERGFSTPVSFIQHGQRCWNFRVLITDSAAQLTARFRDASTRQISSVTTQKSAGFLPEDNCVLFPDVSKVASVDMIQYSIVPESEGLDIGISFVCAQPLVSCWHTITGIDADINNLSVGDTIEVSVTCQNYPSVPARTEDITASFRFDTSIGTMRQSAVCTGITTSSVVGNTFDFTATLAPSQQASCKAVIDLIAPGVASNVAAEVTTTAGENPPIRSNKGTNIHGTQAFCDPPTLSTIVVTGGSPTEPVQHSCHRHGTCYRLVEDNPCVFAANCVDRVCSVFCFDTQECKLEPLCAGSFWQQS